MKWSREEYIELMTFGETERQMFVELFGPLIGLDKEWRKQGASEDEIEMTAFDFDYVDCVDCGGNTGMVDGYKPQVLEDNDEYTISIDSLGRKSKLCKGFATIALPMEFPVKDMDSWLKIKPWFEFSESRIDWNQLKHAKTEQKKGALVTAFMPGGFDLPRELLGEVGMSFCYFDHPELMKDILDTAKDTVFKVLDRISDKVTIDNIMVHEDMAGKSGPMIGPDLINEFIKPYYRKIWDMLSSKGTKLFSQDSDGNMNSVIDAFLDCGINIMMPAEPASGMDIVELRKKHGNKLAFKGGIDKHVLRQDKEAIRRELEYKLQSLMQQGGTVFGLDHRITNGTSIENYRYYVDTAREILGIPPRGENRGWKRMAF
ncbi:MAG: uroporphyrinogen decarboxylase family protein [Saccharofermentanales bacterium]